MDKDEFIILLGIILAVLVVAGTYWWRFQS